MYNIHQYNNSVRQQEQSRTQEQRYAKYLLRHGDFKERASLKVKQRADSFLQQQQNSPKHFTFQDDHFIRWRPNKQFRDIQDKTKFLSFKSFRHKPNYEMDKYYNERERKEIKELGKGKQLLIQSKIIPEAQRGRSLRCQGPLAPKIEFREKKKPEERMQPHMRWTCITDRERMNESAMSFDDKFKTLYNSFEMTKSKLGRTTISPPKDKNSNSNRYNRRADSLDMINSDSMDMTKSRPFYFDKDGYEGNPSVTPNSKLLINPEGNSSGQSSPLSPKRRTYFKLAKTMQLFSTEQQEKQRIDQLLKRTQYERKKDMTNIRHNLHGQNHIKAPIL